MSERPQKTKGKGEQYGEKLGALLGKGLDWLLTDDKKKSEKKEEK